jgi:hypothetical protein
MIQILRSAVFAYFVLLSTNPADASCGASFCTVNTDWRAQGAWSQPGLQVDMRYEFVEQNRLMSGSHRVAVGDIPRDHDEVRTLNRNLVLGFDYNFADGWGVGVQLPWVARNHEHTDTATLQDERWKFSELGDVRVAVRLPLLSGDNGFGMTLGLKLPTGRTDIRNSDGMLAERSLQAGTGSTDTLLGLAYHSRPSHELGSWFAQIAGQHAIAIRDGYKPGNRYNADVGWRYAFSHDFNALLQANFQWRERDQGPRAEPNDTGGRVLYLSPGIAYSVTSDTQLYAFTQVPVYSYVNGVQLTTGKNIALGISQRF